MKALGLTSRMVLAAAVVGLLIAGTLIVVLLANREQQTALRRAERAQAVIAQAGIVQNQVLDLGGATRGYVLTGDPAQLQAWRRTRAAVEPGADLLETLAADDSAALRAQALTLGREVSAYRREYADPLIALARRDRDAANATSFQLDARARSLSIRSRLTQLVGAARAASRKATADAQSGADRARTLAIIALLLGVLTVVGIVVYLARAIVAPVRRLAAQLGRLGEGDLSARAEGGTGEIGALSDAFNRMAQRIEEDQHEIERRRAEAESQNVELEQQNVELETQQAELERALAYVGAEKARAEVFHRFGSAIATESDITALAEVTLQQLCVLGSCPVGVFYAASDEEEAETLPVVAVRGLADSERPGPLAPGQGLAGQALRERSPVQGDYPGGGLPISVLGRPVAVHRELHMPLVYGDRTLGLVSLARLNDVPFAAPDLESITGLSGQAAIALSNLLAARRIERQANIAQALFAATPVGIALTDEDGEVLLVNELMRTLLGGLDLPESDNLLARLGGLAPLVAAGTLPDQAGGVALDPGVQDQGEFSLEVTGRSFEWVVGGVPDLDGNLLGRVMILREVTAERESERLREQFVALVSHELRTPMTSVLGYIQLVLETGELSPENAELLEVVARNSDRLVRLIGDLILVSQARAGRLSMRIEEFDLRGVAADSAEAARPLAAASGVTLRVSSPDDPVLVSGDATRLRQVMDNLLGNAVKFTPQGGWVELGLARDGDEVSLAVSDSGPGISQDDQAQLFEPFFRAASTAGSVSGSGLGLAVVRAIVEAHGGRVGVDSSPAGTTFAVRLPVAERRLVRAGRPMRDAV